MHCPNCKSYLVASVPSEMNTWQCQQSRCLTKFDRDKAAIAQGVYGPDWPRRPR